MKGYDPSSELSYLTYWDVNNLYGSEISQKLAVDGFKWRKYKFTFGEEFIDNFDEDSYKEYKVNADIGYPKKLHKLYSDLFLLPKRTKIDKGRICIARKQWNTHKIS